MRLYAKSQKIQNFLLSININPNNLINIIHKYYNTEIKNLIKILYS